MSIQTGDRFGKLVTVEKINKNTWSLMCDCGKMVDRSISSILRVNKKVPHSCGCARKGIAPPNLEQWIKAGESTRLKKGLVPDHKKIIDESLLRLMYLDLGMSLEEIGKVIDRPHSSVVNYLKVYGISRRPAGFQIGNQIQFGDKHYNWKGGVSTLASSIRSSGKNIKWRKACFDRDGYRCVKCRSREDICVHHKKPFAQILKDNNITSLEEAFVCEEFWDVNNGETLCGIHHDEIHSNNESRS
jgi:hypothetical protein